MSTISVNEQHKPNVTHIHGRANEDDVPLYGTVLMASESPGVEHKPHDGDNQVTALVETGASDNYLYDQLILSPSTVARFLQSENLYRTALRGVL